MLQSFDGKQNPIIFLNCTQCLYSLLEIAPILCSLIFIELERPRDENNLLQTLRAENHDSGNGGSHHSGLNRFHTLVGFFAKNIRRNTSGAYLWIFAACFASVVAVIVLSELAFGSGGNIHNGLPVHAINSIIIEDELRGTNTPLSRDAAVRASDAMCGHICTSNHCQCGSFNIQV